MTAGNVVFCASLPDAFEKMGMSYPDREPKPGEMVRFSTNGKPGNKSGWCRLFPDSTGAAFGCWRDDLMFTWQYRDADAPPPSKEEREAANLKHEQMKRDAAADLEKQYARAADKALNIFGQTTDLDTTHDYVTRKGITPHHARRDKDGSITIPVYGADGKLQSLQFIGADGSKRFLYQGKMRDGRLMIGAPRNTEPIIVCEGWATGCSIHDATGATVAVSFSGSNMRNVSADMRRKFPNAQVIIAADLDAHGAGLKYAQAAAVAGSPATINTPVFQDGRTSGDFNDVHQAEGANALRAQFSAKPQTASIALFNAPGLFSCDARDGTNNTRPLTEYGNAQRLFDTHGDRLRYVHDAQGWITWGDSWQWDTDSAGIRSKAAALPNTIYREGGEYLNDAEHFAKWARRSQEQRTVNAAVSMLSDFSQIRLPLACIDAEHYTVGFNQARHVIDLRTGATRPATQFDYVTKSLAADRIGDAPKALRWIEFLAQVFEDDQELIDWMKRFCGYLLTGSTQEQIFLFCFGHGANGKSVFIEVLKHIAGDYARAIASETLSESKRQAGGATPDLAALIGARLVICGETEDNTAMAESLVKSLVSGDSMAVRQLYAAPVQFTPGFKLLMAGNHKPIVRGNDNGIWRRVRLVPFRRTFAPNERDPHLLAKLKAEAPHILAWMVQGCIDWQRKGLADTPASIRDATDAYQVDQDLTGRWLSECTSPDKYAETPAGELYANYKTWSEENGLRPASAVSLGRRLSERGFDVRQSNGKRFWSGLALSVPRQDDYARAKDGF